MSAGRIGACTVLLGALLAAGPPARAQDGVVRFTAGAVLAGTRVSREAAQYLDPLTAASPGAEISLRVWRLHLDARYLQGPVASNTGPVSDEPFIDTELLLGISPLPGLTIKGGRHLQRVPMEVGAQRWLFWELRLRGETSFGLDRLRGYLEGWWALVGESELSQQFRYGQGAEAGLILEFADAPLWGRVGYRLGRARTQEALSPETTEQLIVGAGFRLESSR